MEGWISLHRKFTEWEWYQDLNVKSLFIHCLLKANFKDKEWRGILIKRGQFFTSLNNLSHELNLSIKQIRNALKKLEKTKEITQKGASNGTMITICKFDYYQDESNIEGKQRASEGQAKGKRGATTNNDNNKDNDNNDYKKKLLSELSVSDVPNKEYFEITTAFWNLFKKNVAEAGGSTKNLDKAKGTWIDSIRLLIEADEQNIDSVRTVFRYLQYDEFWKTNILSTAKLRKQFDTLLLNAKSKSNGTTKKQPATTDAELIEVLSKHFDEK